MEDTDPPTKQRVRVNNCYSEKDFQTLKVVVFNRNTLGKNPYFVADLSSMMNVNSDGFYVLT